MPTDANEQPLSPVPTDEISFPLDQPRLSPAVPEQPHSPVTSMDQQLLTPLPADEHMLSPVTQTLDSLVPTNLHEDVDSNCKEHSDSTHSSDSLLKNLAVYQPMCKYMMVYHAVVG